MLDLMGLTFGSENRMRQLVSLAFDRSTTCPANSAVSPGASAAHDFTSFGHDNVTAPEESSTATIREFESCGSRTYVTRPTNRNCGLVEVSDS